MRVQNLVVSASVAPAEARRSKGRQGNLPPLSLDRRWRVAI
jgi:hypothetical protein